MVALVSLASAVVPQGGSDASPLIGCITAVKGWIAVTAASIIPVRCFLCARVGGMTMENLCSQFWICSAVPPELQWVLIIGGSFLLNLILLGVPVANILHRAGHSRWWTILAFVPLVNLIGLWMFAFTRWPNAVR